MYLRPSEIYFSQREINNRFDKNSVHRGVNIGRTLDDLAEGRCRVESIPTLSVMRRDNRWVTADNRRLWVFRHLEKLGKCETIPVKEVYYIDSRKLNSLNGGRTVKFYDGRYADGIWHSEVLSIAPDAPLAPCAQTNRNIAVSHSSSSNFSDFNFSSLPHSRTRSSVLESHTPRSSVIYDRSPNVMSIEFITLSSESTNLCPSDVRYTKESIQINGSIKKLPYTLLSDNDHSQSVDAITVYKAFKKYWVTDGNKRLWAFNVAKRSKPNIRIPVVVKENKDEFLDFMRKDRPWLSVIEIMQSGREIDVSL